jgi:transcriptional regulator of acetoin/glycerol metabolism
MADPTVTRHANRVLRVAQGMPTDDPIAPNEAIGSSWKRCVREYSLDPVRVYSPAVVSTGDLRGRQVQHEQLIQIASAEMDSLYDQICGSGYALLLTDASGVILCEKIDTTLRSLFRSAGLIIGADWSELHEGTNGIGTCISVDRPVTVHRSEHFRARHIGLSCSGAPIHDPAGSLLAVLDASTVDARDTRASQAHTMALVNMSAQLIEKCIFLQHHQGTNIVRFHARPELVNLLHDGSLALGPDGTVIAADGMAVRLLAARGRRDLVGRTLEEIFDTRMEDLLTPASLARQALWPLRDARLGRRFFASLHLGTANGPGWSGASAPSLRGAPGIWHRPRISSPRNTSRPGGATISSERRPGAPPAVATRPPSAIEAREARSVTTLTLENLAGNDSHMSGVLRKASRIANSTLPVLIQGPTGSGKECLARALHGASPRASRPFIAVNCAALPETLIESELFGYGPGAFTGAKKEGRKGKIVQSSGGTLFLDEIGDMPLLLQTRLLRVLEEQEVIPLGAETGVPVDLRVICASNRDLRDMIASGGFREDLYYRLNGITLQLPRLAARSDKDLLIRRILAEQAGSDHDNAIDAEALQCLTRYTWPGNIRELRNVIRSAFAICDDNIIRLADLPAELRNSGGAELCAGPGATPTPDEPPSNPLARAEREALLQVIRANHGNLCTTAKQLGMSRNALYRRLKRHAITVDRVASDRVASDRVASGSAASSNPRA